MVVAVALSVSFIIAAPLVAEDPPRDLVVPRVQHERIYAEVMDDPPAAFAARDDLTARSPGMRAVQGPYVSIQVNVAADHPQVVQRLHAAALADHQAASRAAVRDVLESGGSVVQETRLWDPAMGRSTSMRGKEEAHDYRYFPDPDLLPVVVDEDWLAAIRDALPELPDARQQRLIDEYGLTAYDADRLTADRDIGDYFEACLAHAPAAKLAANWILGELSRHAKERRCGIEELGISASRLAGLIDLVETGAVGRGEHIEHRGIRRQRHAAPRPIVRSRSFAQHPGHRLTVIRVERRRGLAALAAAFH